MHQLIHDEGVMFGISGFVVEPLNTMYDISSSLPCATHVRLQVQHSKYNQISQYSYNVIETAAHVAQFTGIYRMRISFAASRVQFPADYIDWFFAKLFCKRKCDMVAWEVTV